MQNRRAEMTEFQIDSNAILISNQNDFNPQLKLEINQSQKCY